LYPHLIEPIPGTIARAIHQASTKGITKHFLKMIVDISLCDQSGAIYTDTEFALLFPVHGSSAMRLW
jgi:hypothetical protein